MKKTLVVVTSAILVIILTIPAVASNFVLGNSQYTLVKSSGISWDDAKNEAAARGGHLVTITSPTENDYIKNTVLNGQEKAYWLGGVQSGDQNKKTPLSNWSWITGEDFTFTDWYPSEPNNAGNKNEIHMSADSRYGFQWNDEGAAVKQQIRGYIIETPTAPTPIPGAVWILGTSLAALFGFKRKFKK
ncbi:lectin-like protein [Maridesulfovibrio zosterae]|uniref:lectin-like protein n=1 Tax=Maridesulfovibrio zosterae TaxID=82171 RepID=UPI0003FC1E14|nr:lectin-like protein [Maridesulfovibrio zosterae]